MKPRDLKREREIALGEQGKGLAPRKIAPRPTPPKRAQNRSAAFWLKQAEIDNLIETMSAQLEQESLSDIFDEFPEEYSDDDDLPNPALLA